MTIRPFAAALGAVLLLSACTSAGSGGSGSASEVIGGFRRDSDTRGTSRRPDMIAGSTAPVLPTIGTPGYGK